MQLIIIAGQAGVGKTTLANFIATESFELGFIPKLMSFAGVLKNIAKDNGLIKENSPEEYRVFCQKLGAEKREENPDYWVEEFEKELQEQIALEEKSKAEGKQYWERCIIVDDCRCPLSKCSVAS